MKKICNLATIHPGDDSRIFRKECFSETRSYQVHYVTCNGEGYKLKNNVHIHGIKRYKSKFQRAIFAPFRIYKKAKLIDADIYVLHEPELLSIALLLKKIHKKCVIYDCHEFYVEEVLHKKWIPFPVRFCLFLYLKCVYCFVVPYLDVVVSVSKQKPIINKRNFVLQNYAAIKEFKNILIRDFEHANCVLYTGTLSPDCFQLIRVAKTLLRNPVEFVFCCRITSSEGFYASKNKLFTSANFKQNCSIEEIKSLSKKCFTGLFCQSKLIRNKICHFYSFTKNYEYMAENLPIIAISRCKNVFFEKFMNNDNHPLGLVVDSDPQAIANAIDYLYENKEVARTMGMNGRKAFETKYNFESEADGFLKFLEEVSQSKNPNK